MIVDTSVAAKWLLQEEQSPAARRLLRRTDLAAPVLIDIEIAAALTKSVRRRKIDDRQARGLHRIFQTAPLDVVREDWTNAAFELSLTLWASLTDCVFLACALDRGDVLVTADKRFFNVVKSRRGFAASIGLLSEL